MTKQQAAQFLSQILSNIKATAQEHKQMENALVILLTSEVKTEVPTEKEK